MFPLFRRNDYGALRKTEFPVSKKTLSAEPMVESWKGVRVILMQGDIEKQECDAIVNFYGQRISCVKQK